MSSFSSSPESSPLASRYTTPSSDLSSPTTAPSLPSTFILLHDGALNSESLGFLFSKYAGTGSLGFVVEACPSSVEEDVWTLQEDGAVAYCVSTTFTPTLDSYIPYISTTKEYAAHLRTVSSTGLRPVLSARLNDSQTLYVLEQPSFSFPPFSAQQAFGSTTVSKPSQGSYRGNIPTSEEWQNLWKAWDLVTMQMIPEEMLHQKPIDLRHKCLFYLGHIPTFLDMLLSKAIGGSPSEPAYFWNIFERGIDPHVDDPTHCHNHSEVPEKDSDWPSLASIVIFRNRVRERLMRLYDELESGQRTLTRKIARTLVMTLEHEGFHIETLLYMLIQRAGTGTLPPPGFHTPEWATLSEQWSRIPAPSMPLPVVGPAQLTMGHDDSESDDSDILSDSTLGSFDNIVDHTYGWDNESPARTVEVGAFQAEWRPITNREYLGFWKSQSVHVTPEMPKSWIEEDSGEIKVQTLYGCVPMDVAGDWPVLASYDELEAYAWFKGGRLPTEPELRLFLDRYDVGHEGGANVGFRNWHPVPSTMGIECDDGRGSNGGVWEWTSTPFGSHDGLVPTKLFTGYSTDFFDGKHRVVLGASYATIPRLTRKTLRNFYQHNYPYPWVGARVVYDMPKL